MVQCSAIPAPNYTVYFLWSYNLLVFSGRRLNVTRRHSSASFTPMAFLSYSPHGQTFDLAKMNNPVSVQNLGGSRENEFSILIGQTPLLLPTTAILHDRNNNIKSRVRKFNNRNETHHKKNRSCGERKTPASACRSRTRHSNNLWEKPPAQQRKSQVWRIAV